MEAVGQELQARDEALKQLKFHLARAQERMVNQAYKARQPADVEVGLGVLKNPTSQAGLHAIPIAS